MNFIASVYMLISLELLNNEAHLFQSKNTLRITRGHKRHFFKPSELIAYPYYTVRTETEYLKTRKKAYLGHYKRAQKANCGSWIDQTNVENLH